MLTISKNTYISELYAYLMLKDNLFKDRAVTIGDDVVNGFPDIFSNDNAIGVEVTCIEERHVYDLINALHKNFGLNPSNFDCVNMKFAGKRLKNANISKNIKFGTKAKERANDQSSKEGILDSLAYVMGKKLMKNYHACKHTFLFLVSDHIKKEHVTINDYREVYLDLCKVLGNKFDGLFVALNDKLYFIDKNDKVNIILNQEQVKNVRKKANFKHLEENLDFSM